LVPIHFTQLFTLHLHFTQLLCIPRMIILFCQSILHDFTTLDSHQSSLFLRRNSDLKLSDIVFGT